MYYTGLKNIEPNEQSTNRKLQETKPKNLRHNHPNNKTKVNANGKRDNRMQKYCEIHGKCNHTTAQCEVIQKHRTEYQNRPNDKNNKKK